MLKRRSFSGIRLLVGRDDIVGGNDLVGGRSWFGSYYLVVGYINHR